MQETKIKRQILGSLMQQMDNMTRSNMGSIFEEKKDQPAPQDPVAKAEEKPAVRTNAAEEIQSFNPIVQLAQRLGK